ncbi:MAG: condensation domain-containing protein, partial [Ruminiclostridium sp.]
ILEDKEFDCTNSRYIEYIQNEAVYMESERMKADKAYWNDKIRQNISCSQLAQRTGGSLETNRIEFNIDENNSKELHEYCTKTGNSLFAIYLTVLGYYLKLIKNENRFWLGTTLLGRSGKK